MDDPGFEATTRRYAAWLSTFMPLREEGLRAKARKMRRGRFAFLRATFYRWRWQWDAVDEAVRSAPPVLSAADAHLENFATWRDAEGRLAWGLSDFDEAVTLPFTSDLVRIATSIALERDDSKDRLRLPRREADAALLDGYREGLRSGRPFVLEDEHPGLRRAAETAFDPTDDWDDLRRKGAADEPPDPVRDLLAASLPAGATRVTFRAVDDKGLGSLGRPRWILLAEWKGGPLAREAKAAAPSAWHMDDPDRRDAVTDHRTALRLSRRSPDPGLDLAEAGGAPWVIRRLSPEARKITLDDIAKADAREPDEGARRASQATLLHAMGAEVANVHIGCGASPDMLAATLSALDGNDPDWLGRAAAAVEARVERDREAFLANSGIVEEMPRP